MEETTTATAKQPIDDVKPSIPDANSTGAEFSDSPLSPQPQKPGTDESNPEAVHEPPKEDTQAEEEPKSDTKMSDSVMAAAKEFQAENDQTKSTSNDHGTHRSSAKKTSNGKGLAALVVVMGVGLAGFVVYVYMATN